MKAKSALMMFAVSFLIAASVPALAKDHAVQRVVVVETADATAYRQQLEQGKAILKSLGSSATIRAWSTKFAGTNVGRVAVTVEYPSIAALAADEAKITGSAEYQAWLKGLDKVRKVVSDSLYQEL
jgi:archaellum component FlaG (FlaF/FlaG flagellin family)